MPGDNGSPVQPHLEGQYDRMTKIQSAVAKEFSVNTNDDNVYVDCITDTASEIVNYIQDERIGVKENMRSGISYNQAIPYSAVTSNHQLKELPTVSSSPPIYNDSKFDKSSSLTNLNRSNNSYSSTSMASTVVSKQFDFSEQCQKHGLEQCILCQMFGGVNMTALSQPLISNDDILGTPIPNSYLAEIFNTLFLCR